MPLSEDNEALSAFRGLSFAPSLSRSRVSKGKPMPADEIGKLVFEKLRAQTSGAKAEIQKNWGTLLPKEFLNKCEPENVRLATLYVRAANSAIAQELSFRERGILSKIRTLKGCQNIKKIRFV